MAAPQHTRGRTASITSNSPWMTTNVLLLAAAVICVSMTEAVDVVVVGAGLAGLTAARRLVNEGGFNVTVLEARPDRYGGRVLTDHSLGIPVDVGANWIPGSGEGNPVSRLARQAGIALANVDTLYGKRWSPHTAQVYNSDFFLQKSVDFIEMMFATAEMARAWPEDVSVLQALNRTAFSRVLNDPLMLLFASDIIVDRTGASLDLISAQLLDAGESLDGTDQIAVTGLDGAIKRLVEEGPGEEKLDVRLGQHVNKITVEVQQLQDEHALRDPGQNPSNETAPQNSTQPEGPPAEDDREDGQEFEEKLISRRLRVETRTGTTYVADAVVMAVSLGILQSTDIVFDPALPDHVLEAIHALGFGVSNKFILEFDEAFWGDEQFYGLAPSKLDQIGLLNTWFSMKTITERNLLVGFISGDSAAETEQWSDEKLQSTASQTLGKMFGAEKVAKSKVINKVRTKWLADPYARGMFSYYPVGSSYEHRDVLTRPVGAHLFIAGEHTNTAYFGTLHGAFFSGQRAAENLIYAWKPRPVTTPETDGMPPNWPQEEMRGAGLQTGDTASTDHQNGGITGTDLHAEKIGSDHDIDLKQNKYISAPDPTDYSYQPNSDLSNLSGQQTNNGYSASHDYQPENGHNFSGENEGKYPVTSRRAATTVALPPGVAEKVGSPSSGSAVLIVHHSLILQILLMLLVFHAV